MQVHHRGHDVAQAGHAGQERGSTCGHDVHLSSQVVSSDGRSLLDLAACARSICKGMAGCMWPGPLSRVPGSTRRPGLVIARRIANHRPARVSRGPAAVTVGHELGNRYAAVDSSPAARREGAVILQRKDVGNLHRHRENRLRSPSRAGRVLARSDRQIARYSPSTPRAAAGAQVNEVTATGRGGPGRGRPAPSPGYRGVRSSGWDRADPPGRRPGSGFSGR